MDNLSQIMAGFAVAMEPMNLLFLFIGALLGTVIGVLPGIGPAAGVALLLPATFGLDPLPAFIMLAGIYYGTMYGNSVSAILINTPGTASSAMTTLDGYPMARAGRGGAALAIAAMASFCAGTLGILLLTFLAIPLSSFALRFGPAEYCALVIFALTAVGGLTGNSVAKGLLAALLGLAIATVGVDLQTGLSRFTMGVPRLGDGIPLIVVIVGVFAVAEVFISIERWLKGDLKPIHLKGRLWATPEEWRLSTRPILRGSGIGFLVGMLPGAGGAIATVLSYSVEKRLAKQPERFGKGAPEGVAGPEAANNASTAGAFVPLLTLGIPGSGTTAVLLAAFILHGIQPGPQLFRTQPELVWGLINSMYLGNIMLLILNLPLIVIFVRVLYMPPGLLMAIILCIASVGVYSIASSSFDLFLLLGFGVLGYVFRKTGVPAAPLILGVVLGGMLEQSFRQAMTLSRSSPEIFLRSPIAMTFLIAAILVLFAPVLIRRIRRSLAPRRNGLAGS